MSTRCTVCIHDTNAEGKVYENDAPIMLYHHSDGYPDFMAPYLGKMMNATNEMLKEAGYPYWWDSERVSACMVALSIEDYSEPMRPYSTDKRMGGYITDKNAQPGEWDKYRPDGGIPVLQPCAQLHGDLEYLYHVYLLSNNKFRITYQESEWDRETQESSWKPEKKLTKKMLFPDPEPVKEEVA